MKGIGIFISKENSDIETLLRIIIKEKKEPSLEDVRFSNVTR